MFGLEMHICRGETSSKTECAFFPQPDFILPPKTIQCENTHTNCIAPRMEKMNTLGFAQMDKVYAESDETNRFKIEDWVVDFTKHFKYLDSFISHHMRDDHDIEKQICSGRK